MTMVRAKLSAALVIEKINTSACTFDTFPSVLAEMKYKGVPDEVLLAMVHAPHGGRGKPIAEPKPEPVAEVRPVENLGGMILRDRSEKPFNARFFALQPRRVVEVRRLWISRCLLEQS